MVGAGARRAAAGWTLAAASLTLLAGAAGLAGHQALAGAGVLAALGATAAAFQRARAGFRPRELRRGLGGGLAGLVALGLGGFAYACTAALPGAWALSGRAEDRLETLPAWAARVEGPLDAVILGPEGHRVTRAAWSVLHRLEALREDPVTLRRLDADDAAAEALVGRAVRPGEVVLSAAGRRVVATDASPRSLAAALRGLADPRPREARFVRPGEPVRPGAPPPFRRAAARLAAELAMAVRSGPATPAARLWVLDSAAGLPVPEVVSGHLARGGGAVLLAEERLGAPWREWLASLGIEQEDSWLLDAEEGRGPGGEVLRVRVPEAPGAPPALLPGCRALRVRPPARRWLLPVAPGRVDLGEAPAAGGATRARSDHEVPAARVFVGGGWLVVLGDRDALRAAALDHPGNQALLERLAAAAGEDGPPLPGLAQVPYGGVDPDLDPRRFRTAAFLLVLGFPALPLLVAGMLGLTRPGGGEGVP